MVTKETNGGPLKRCDQMISFVVKVGYRNLELNEDVRNPFLFRYKYPYFRSKELPNGWRCSPIWFVNLLKPMVRRMRVDFSIRVLSYIDDYLFDPSFWRVSTQMDCAEISVNVGETLEELDLVTRRWGIGGGNEAHLELGGGKGHGADGVHSNGSKGEEEQRKSVGTVAEGAKWATVGDAEEVIIVLWVFNANDVANHSGEVLYEKSLRCTRVELDQGILCGERRLESSVIEQGRGRLEYLYGYQGWGSSDAGVERVM